MKWYLWVIVAVVVLTGFIALFLWVLSHAGAYDIPYPTSRP